MLNRFSSRLTPLDREFLREKLRGARSYRRIAGYFRSSIFEIAAEELDNVGQIQIVCNSERDPHDIRVSRAAREQALKAQWNKVPVETESLLYRDRYRKLYELLTRGNVEVRVVPRDGCAFIHGKAGAIELADGSKTCFMGSVNETREGWKEHYELLWEDTSKEGVTWVEDEFNHLWEQGFALPLSLAASALVASLLGDGAVLILCPATLTQQWQVELYDKLGVPSAVWLLAIL